MKKIKYLAALLFCAGIANAAIIQPVSVTDVGTASAAGDAGSHLDNLFNGSGLSGVPVDDGDTAGGVTHDTGVLANMWTTVAFGPDYFAGVTGTTEIQFDLGGAHNVQSAYIWGYHYFGSGNSPTVIDVSYSTDGSTFGSTQTITLSSPPDADVPAQAVSLSAAPAGTTHVRFLFIDNGYGTAAGGDRCGLAEVRFGTASVAQQPPEIISFTATPTSVDVGETVTLSWTTTGTEDTLTLDPGGIDVTGYASTQLMVNAETTYSLTADNAAGSSTNFVTVTLNGMIVTPVGVTDSGSANAAGDAGSHLSFLINGDGGNGLSDTPIDDGATAGGVTHSTGNLAHLWTTVAAGSDYFETETGTTQIDFDLGGAYDVQSVYIWGYHYFGSANSATAITVSFSTDGSTFTNPRNILLNSPPAADVPAQVRSLSNAPAGTTHVRFLITDNGGGDRCGLGEVRFGTRTVAENPAVISSFTATPSAVTNGATVTLEWATAYADALTLETGTNGVDVVDVLALTSTQVVVNAETMYTLTATNSLGSVAESITVTILEDVPGTIILPTSLVSEEYNFNSASTMIDNAGMTPDVNDGDALNTALAAQHVFDGGYGQSYLSTDPGGFPSDFFDSLPDGDTDVDLVFDLGEETSLDGIVLWNYQNTGGGAAAVGNSARTVDIRVNTAAEGSTTFNGAATTITLKPVTDGDGISDNDLGGVNAAQYFYLGELTGRYVQISITDNYLNFQDITGGGDRVGLGEVRLVSGSAIAVTDPIENFIITGPVAIAGGQGMVLSWDTSDGQFYDVQSKSNLITQATWNTITNVTGDGGSISVTTTVDGAEAFYQVETPTP